MMTALFHDDCMIIQLGKSKLNQKFSVIPTHGETLQRPYQFQIREGFSCQVDITNLQKNVLRFANMFGPANK